MSVVGGDSTTEMTEKSAKAIENSASQTIESYKLQGLDSFSDSTTARSDTIDKDVRTHIAIQISG